MGGCCQKGEVSPEHEPYGPVGVRKCRDVFFLLLFIVFWAGMFVIAWSATTNGEPYR